MSWRTHFAGSTHQTRDDLPLSLKEAEDCVEEIEGGVDGVELFCVLRVRQNLKPRQHKGRTMSRQLLSLLLCIMTYAPNVF